MLSSAAMSRHAKPHLRCAECPMHLSLCICALLPRITTRTRVVLVLHQLEAKKSTNTGVLAARCLENSVAVYRGRAPGVNTADPLDDQLSNESDPLLLYPHASATPLGAWSGATKPITLIIPDGNWQQASRTRRLRAQKPRFILPAPLRMSTSSMSCASVTSRSFQCSKARRDLHPGTPGTSKKVQTLNLKWM